MALVCFVLLIMALPAAAQTDTVQHPDREVLVMGGLSVPYLPLEFRTYWKTGWNAGIGYGYSFDPGSLGYGAVYATVEYSRFAFNPTAYRDSMLAPFDPANLTPEAAAFKAAPLSRPPVYIFTASVNFKGVLFSPEKKSIAPYFLLGLGYMYYSVDDVAADTVKAFRMDGKKGGAISWTAGIGVEFPVTESIAAFIQGKSVLGVVDKTRQYFPLSAGVRVRM